MTKKLMRIGFPVVAADQAIKAVIRCQTLGQTIFEIPGVVAITPSFNTGAAFSLLIGLAHDLLRAGIGGCDNLIIGALCLRQYELKALAVTLRSSLHRGGRRGCRTGG